MKRQPWEIPELHDPDRNKPKPVREQHEDKAYCTQDDLQHPDDTITLWPGDSVTLRELDGDVVKVECIEDKAHVEWLQFRSWSFGLMLGGVIGVVVWLIVFSVLLK